MRRFHLSGAAIDVSASLDFALGLGSGFLEISSLVWAHVSSCPASQASRSTFSSKEVLAEMLNASDDAPFPFVEVGTTVAPFPEGSAPASLVTTSSEVAAMLGRPSGCLPVATSPLARFSAPSALARLTAVLTLVPLRAPLLE